MAAEDYFVYRHHCPDIPDDNLDVWRPILPDDWPVIQITQSDGITASINYTPDDGIAIARAILEAAGIEPKTAFAD